MYRQNIHFPAKDALLREDVHALGALLGEILLEQCGNARFSLVEADRVAAIRRREGEPDGERELLAGTRGRTPEETRDLVRAFSTWFQIVNLSEKVHRIRRRREYLASASQTQPDGLEETFARLKRAGATLGDAMSLLQRLCFYPVFTAHPTESTRRTILRKQQNVAELMLERLDPSMTPRERRDTWEQIRTELTSGWQTEDHPRERLTVADEREHVLFYFVEVLYRVVPGFYEDLAFALGRVFGEEVAPRDLPRVLRFGSWVGGDMDGQPDVHAKTIRDTLHRQQLVVLNAYFLEAQRLGERLSQSASRIRVSAQLQSRIDEYTILVPLAHDGAPARHDKMPYRTFCSQVAARLRNTYDGRPNRYESASQLLGDLELMADSLRAHNGARAGLFYVERLICRVRAFGLHLATLDVRQQADVHRAVVGRGLADPDFCSRPAAERYERLRCALERDEAPTQALDATGRRTLAVFEQMLHCRHRYGRDAVGDYVVSGAEGPDDVLAVLLLARWAEMVDKRVGEVPLDVVPLFESTAALAASGETMRVLLADAAYRRHIAARGNHQGVMIGYGDANKESGFAASRWSLYEGQGLLAEAVAGAGVELQVFHGRATAGSRSGSRPEMLLRSVPAGSFNGLLRVTEQGEVINNSYGLRPIAVRSLEQALGAACKGAVQQRDARPVDPAFTAALATVAAASAKRYHALVDDGNGFYEYFREATPIDVIERMQIGSRPIRRSAGTDFGGLRALPWGFAWSQSRHMIPGWYGLGSGLDAAAAVHGPEVLQRMLAGWDFFGILLDDAEQVLAKADMSIAGWYAELAEPAARQHFVTVREEYERSRQWLLRLRGVRELLDGEPTLQRGIKLRNPYVDPMHLMQIDLLRRWRAAGRDDPALLEALIASITGIAQGLQATG